MLQVTINEQLHDTNNEHISRDSSTLTPTPFSSVGPGDVHLQGWSCLVPQTSDELSNNLPPLIWKLHFKVDGGEGMYTRLQKLRK